MYKPDVNYKWLLKKTAIHHLKALWTLDKSFNFSHYYTREYIKYLLYFLEGYSNLNDDDKPNLDLTANNFDRIWEFVVNTNLKNSVRFGR